ncbi:MAG: hypothetical protein IAE94_05490 [Chthoniobacterales bacterium]|nr:hypothetical protein [Chthoniobacterales bacterium]
MTPRTRRWAGHPYRTPGDMLRSSLIAVLLRWGFLEARDPDASLLSKTSVRPTAFFREAVRFDFTSNA